MFFGGTFLRISGLLFPFLFSAYAAGNPQISYLWNDFHLNLRKSSVNNAPLACIPDSSGVFYLFWKELPSDDSMLIKGRCFLENGLPKSDEVILSRVNSNLIPHVIGSGYGNFALLIQDTTDLSVKIKKFNSDFEMSRYSYDHFFKNIKNNTIVAHIDQENAMIVAYNSRYFENTERVSHVKIYYINRAGIADSLEEKISDHSCNTSKDCYFHTLTSGAPSGPKQITLFFSFSRTDVIDWFASVGRVLSYESNSLSWKTQYTDIVKGQEDMSWSVIYLAAGREDYKGSICIVEREGKGIYFLDSAVNVEKSISSENRFIGIASGYNGSFAIISKSNTNDSLMLYTFGRQNAIPVLQGYAGNCQTAAIGMDRAARPLVFRSYMGSLYFSRPLCPDSLFTRRINDISGDPRVSSSAISGNGTYRFTVWKEGNTDSLYLCGWKSNDGSEKRTWYGAVKTNGGSVFPEIKAKNDTLALVYMQPEGNGDTSVMLKLWNTSDNNEIATKTVSDNGVKALNPSLCFSGEQIAVAWEDKRSEHGDTPYVYLQLFDKSGNVTGKNKAISPGNRPCLHKAYPEGYLLAFQYTTTATSSVGGVPVFLTLSNVYACMINNKGEIAGEIIKLNDNQNNGVDVKGCSFSSSSRSLILWREIKPNLSSQIYGCILGPDNTLQGNKIRFGYDSSVTEISVSALNGNHAVVVWHDINNGINFLIVNDSGIVKGNSLKINNRPINSDIPVSLSCDADNNTVFISWIEGTFEGRNKHKLTGDLFKVMIEGSTGVEGNSIAKKPRNIPPLLHPCYRNSYDVFSLHGRKTGDVTSVKKKASGIYISKKKFISVR